MNPVKRLTRGVTSLGVLLAFALPGPPADSFAMAGSPGLVAYAAPAGPSTTTGTRGDPTAGTGSRTVNLITGDRVTVTTDHKASVEPGPGRTGIQFLTRRVAERLHVIPVDALALIRSGRLDERLFDVTALLEYRYDRRKDLPLLVTYTGADARVQGQRAVVAAGARVVRELPPVAGLAIAVDRAGLPRFWTELTGPEPARTMAAAVRTVWLDGLRQPTLAESVPQVGAPTAWAAGFDGTGVTVAVLDTGVDETHPDLVGQVTGQRNFTDGVEDDRDVVGHGTHVASTVAGTGAGRFTGVAPGARLLDGKVCASSGCTESSIIAGMQWAAESGARVVNMSLTGHDTPVVDPIEQAVGELTEAHDTLFVVAAGNVPGEGTVGSPATADAALAVGAVSKSDQLAGFSSQGPRAGDGAIKPDLTAPGLDIVAARSIDSGTDVPEGSGISMSGTSMATPHVAGAAAILAQRQPDLPAGNLKAALMAAARPNPELSVFAQGAGRLDVAAAIDQWVTADPPSLSFGRQSWPHDDDTPVRRTVSYRNEGTAPVTLQLGVRATGPDGTTVPAGMFAVTPSSVTVPAGGTAEATVTADTAGSGGPVGQLTGQLTATVGGDGGSVPTPLALDREVESYDVTVTHLGQDGEPTDGHLTMLAGLADAHAISMPATSTGTATLRVPKGRYSALTAITSPSGDTYLTSVLAQPELTVSGDQSLTLDARLGKPLSVTVPNSGARQVFSELATSVLVNGRTVEVGSLGTTFERFLIGRVGPDRPADGFVSRVTATFAPGDPADYSYAYLLCWQSEDQVPSGFTRQVTTAELATVQADHGHESAGSNGRKLAWAVLPESTMGGFAHATTFPLPSTRIEYYNADGRAQWFRSVDETTGSGDQQAYVTSLVAPAITYRAGQSYQEQWSRGVFGPTVATPPYEHQWVTRLGDTLTVQAPLYGDGVGRAGFSSIATGRITLERGGETVAELDGLNGTIELPPETGDYRLTMTAERGGPATLSTRTSVTWTFRSGHVDGDTPVRLPVSTVRFSPRVDNDNSTPAGQTGTIPVGVTAQPESGAGANEDLTVEVSYDDGVNWAPAEVTAGQAVLRHPAEPGYVSLRASATDTDGNTVSQTVIRAYKIS